MLGKHLRFYLAISVEEMLEDDVNGLLDVVSVTITQGTAVLCVNISDYLLL